MKKSRLVILLLMFIPIPYSLLPITQVFGAFQEMGWGTRPAGMGGTFVGLADDAAGILFNPAGIARLKSAQGTFMYAQPYTGLEESTWMNYLGIAYPFKPVGNFGLVWANTNLSGVYREDTVCLNYARQIIPSITAGLNFKYLSHQYTLDEYTQEDIVFEQGRKKGAFTLDVGLLFFALGGGGFGFGFAAQNLIPAKVGLQDKDIVPLQMKAGLVYRLRDFWVVEALTGLLDLTYRNINYGTFWNKYNLHWGTEAWFLKHLLGVRLGGNCKEVTLGGSYYSVLREPYSLQIDYAFSYPLRLGVNLGSHRISLTFKFGTIKIK